jgi:ribose transport system ATP-binding protein
MSGSSSAVERSGTNDVGRPGAGQHTQAVSQSPLLEVFDVTKRFGGVRALSAVSLSLKKGEVVGLVGENGAGKSTLLKTISGNLRPDSGAILVNGRQVALRNYAEANREGIFHIYQDLALIPTLSVYENVLLAHEAAFSRFGVIDNRKMLRHVTELLAEFGHERIDASQKVEAFDLSTRQVIEIIKSFALAKLAGIESPVMLLDEPTAALTGDEVDFLMRLIQATRKRAAIIYVSHRLSEVIDISDRLYVLKDGAMVAELPAAGVAENQLHELMVGRTRDEFFYREQKQGEPDGAAVLEVSGLSRFDSFADVAFRVRAGEIVGVAGLLGSGKSDLAQVLAGALPGATGTIKVDGVAIPESRSIRTMSDAGVGYLPPDRRDGVIPPLSVASNMSLARLTRRGESYWLDLAREKRDAVKFVSTLGIKTAGVDAQISTLSGGNQQKVLLARWLLRQAKVLILDNPTNGVDAGAKEEIYSVLRQIAAEGVGILLVSDDLLEVIGLSNRILVMRGGAIVREVPAPPGNKPGEVELVADMV